MNVPYLICTLSQSTRNLTHFFNTSVQTADARSYYYGRRRRCVGGVWCVEKNNN